MYIEHPEFHPPRDEHTKVWRYMDFTKFVSMLDTSELFFSRTDQFDDPFEGSYPKRNVSRLCEMLGTENYEALSNTRRSLCPHTLVNCWHMSEHESDAMWKLYTRNKEGIAIQSTFRRLCNAFAEAEQEVHAGTVDYLDYETDVYDDHNTFSGFLHKRKGFEHERELRVIYQDLGQGVCHYGLYIPISLSTLVERVHIVPFAADWFADLVRSVTKTYCADLQVVRSSLDGEPEY